MITWMQKRRKYMLITMWIAVITFVGAGAVDWGGSSYGSRASSVAKVGNVEISNREFSRLRSNMFEYFRSQANGDFTEEMAKKYQLNQRVLNQLVMKALTLNLAESFDLSISDEEVIKAIQETEEFQIDGAFNLDKYKNLLKRIRFQNKEYEKQVRDDLISKRIMTEVAPVAAHAEVNAFMTANSIADKIKYKVLNSNSYKTDINDKDLKNFWEFQKAQYQTPEVINVAYITQKALKKDIKDEDAQAFYTRNRSDFLNVDGKVLEFAEAKESIISRMNDEATQMEANYLKVDWKNFDHKTPTKNRPAFTHKVQTLSFDMSNPELTADVISKLKLLPADKPYLKAEKVGSDYVVYKLLSIKAPREQTFEEAKAAVTPAYVKAEKQKMLQAEVAKQSENFKGNTTGFVRASDTNVFKGLTETETTQALAQLFKSNTKAGNIAVSNSKVLLYEIQEQKLLLNAKKDENLDSMVQTLKEQAHSDALTKALDKAYPTINYLQ
jgi:peptidyl-prolyl cis-trans isomerase D